MTKIKLIAIDLDGTLLDNAGNLPPANIQAIKQVQDQGIKVILATGKTRQSAVHIIDQLGLSLPGVFSQGLIIHDGDGTILHETTLPSQLADDILQYLDQARLPYIIYNSRGLFIPQADAYYDNITSKYDEPEPQVIGSMAGKAAELRVNKILVGDKSDLQARRKELQTTFGDRVTILQAVPEYLEIIPQGVSKGAGLQWLLNHLRIAPQAVLAIGDGENDIEMLQIAGTGVAMGNAHAQVLEIADEVVSSNEEGGVAEACRRFILDKLPDSF